MIKSINKKITSIVMTGVTLVTIPTLTSCSKKNEDGLYSISQNTNEFDRYSKTIIRNGEPVTAYNGGNIVVTIDKDSFDVKEYICVSSSLDYLDDIYDLRTGELIIDKSNLEVENYSYFSKKNFNAIKDNKYIVPFMDLGDYIEGFVLNRKYTIEEIEEIETKLVESLAKIKNYEKIKSKS